MCCHFSPQDRRGDRLIWHSNSKIIFFYILCILISTSNIIHIWGIYVLLTEFSFFLITICLPSPDIYICTVLQFVLLLIFYVILILLSFTEKHELVDLFYNRHIPVNPKRGVEKLTANFAGSVPNLKPLNDFFGKENYHYMLINHVLNN